MVRYQRIVLHIPHSSPVFPKGYEDWSVGIGRDIVRWTDWFTDWLFISATGNDPRIVPVCFPFSRFFCDVERLPEDPMESIGQGIVYTDFGPRHRILSTSRKEELFGRYYTPHIERLKSFLTPSSFLIDCHSFPEDLSDMEVCIGFNSDWSHPEEATLRMCAGVFVRHGFRVGLNEPYSNSISPAMPFPYSSMMIELNKRTYMDQDGQLAYGKATRIMAAVGEMYGRILSL